MEKVDQKQENEFVEATVDDTVTYEMVFEAPNCDDSNIKECVVFNFRDEAKKRKFQIEDAAYDINRKESKLLAKMSGDTFKNLTTYEIKTKNRM